MQEIAKIPTYDVIRDRNTLFFTFWNYPDPYWQALCRGYAVLHGKDSTFQCTLDGMLNDK